MTPARSGLRASLDDPTAFLDLVAPEPQRIDLDEFAVCELFALVGLSALGRNERIDPPSIGGTNSSGGWGFAQALGLSEVIGGGEPAAASQPARTVRMIRAGRTSATEQMADSIARLLISDEEHRESRKVVYYVLNELLRIALQHSHDTLGCVVGAQLNDRGRHEDRPTVQVAVADTGIGIPASLASRHKDLSEPVTALDRSLWPHVSSTFDFGDSGSASNAGMGLFFIAEMSKLAGGRLLIASRGASILLEGEGDGGHGRIRLLPGAGYPGTLVAFEMPASAPQSYDDIIETIRTRAQERTPKRASHKWLVFDVPPPASKPLRIMMKHTKVEDAGEAIKWADEVLIPRVMKRQPVILDFSGLPVVTQSWAHALLYEAIRLAWARKVPLYIDHAAPGARSTLELLQNYALGG